jgi:nucleoside phosphorylase
MKPIVDYLIVIPLDEEFRYFREVLGHDTGRPISTRTDGPLLYAPALLPTVSGEESAVIVSVGRMTEAPTQAAVTDAVTKWPPAAVIMVGIAGSLVPDDVKLGDVIVPSRVFGYTDSKAEVEAGKQQMTYRQTGHPLDCRLSALARAVHLDFADSWRASSREAGRADAQLEPRIAAEKGSDRPKIHITDHDCLASGNVVVASKEFAEAVRAALGRTVKAVEMEAKGLCEALARMNPAPPALVARGISDLADESKSALEKDFKDGWRRYAAQNASRFALEVIRRRPATADGYRPLAPPAFPMKPHPESARLCMDAGVVARRKGMRNVAFSPFMICVDGLPTTTLTLEAVAADGSPSAFEKLLLRRGGERSGALVEARGEARVTHRIDRTGDPPTLDLLAGLPADAVGIAVTARDEFGRERRAEWRSPG